MNSRKSEDSVLASHPSDRAACENHEKSPARQLTPANESATFSSPVLDQLSGILPDFNNRLSPEQDLRLSPAGALRLSPGHLPGLVSGSALGLVSCSLSSPLTGLKIEKPETPVGNGLEIKPDLAGRTLEGDKICSLAPGADFPIGHLKSRMLTVKTVEDEKKEK